MAGRLDEIQQAPGAGTSSPFGQPGFSQQATLGLGKQHMPTPPRAGGRVGAAAPKLSNAARQGALGRLAQVLAGVGGTSGARGPAGQTAPPGRGHGKNLFVP